MCFSFRGFLLQIRSGSYLDKGTENFMRLLDVSYYLAPFMIEDIRSHLGGGLHISYEGRKGINVDIWQKLCTSARKVTNK